MKKEDKGRTSQSIDSQMISRASEEKATRKKKQGMKSLGYAPEEEDMIQTEGHEFYSGLIIKIGERCFFYKQEGHFRMDCR